MLTCGVRRIVPAGFLPGRGIFRAKKLIFQPSETKKELVSQLVSHHFPFIIFKRLVLPEDDHGREKRGKESDRDPLDEVCEEEEWAAVDALPGLLVVAGPVNRD